LTIANESWFAANGHAPSDATGKCALVGLSCGLEEVIAAFDELLLLPDRGAVYAALAGIVANYAEGDVVWPLLVGPPAAARARSSRR
jgi:hypothetical protein